MTGRDQPLRSSDPPQDQGRAPDAVGAAPASPGAEVTQDQADALQGAADEIAVLAEELTAAGARPPTIIAAAEKSTTGTPTAFQMPVFQTSGSPLSSKAIDLLSDVNLNVKIELGRTRMLVSDVLKLSEGSVVELDKLAGDPVDIYVNDRPIARGEVLVLNENFCVRINEILTPQHADPTKAAG